MRTNVTGLAKTSWGNGKKLPSVRGVAVDHDSASATVRYRARLSGASLQWRPQVARRLVEEYPSSPISSRASFEGAWMNQPTMLSLERKDIHAEVEHLCCRWDARVPVHGRLHDGRHAQARRCGPARRTARRGHLHQRHVVTGLSVQHYALGPACRRRCQSQDQPEHRQSECLVQGKPTAQAEQAMEGREGRRISADKNRVGRQDLSPGQGRERPTY